MSKSKRRRKSKSSLLRQLPKFDQRLAFAVISAVVVVGVMVVARIWAATPAPLKAYSYGFAPYAYISWGGVNMTTYQTGSGAKNFVSAFIVSTGGCTPAWDGDSTQGLTSSRSTTIQTDINGVRAHGGDVAVSFGGDTGTKDTDIADTCTNVSSLQAAYQSVVSRYGLNTIDFDVEGITASNSAGNARRAQALAGLQQANPNLHITLTIGADVTGLSSTGLGLVNLFYR